MGDDASSRTGWGVVLHGSTSDLKIWQEELKQPFDPWVEELKQPSDPWVMETEKDGLILRSSVLNDATTVNEAYERAEALMDGVNGAIGARHPMARVVRIWGIAEILSDGTPRRLMSVPASEPQARGDVTIISAILGSSGVVLGSNDKPKQPPPTEPSDPQRWLSIASKDDLLADALTYFTRGDDWFDVYKALECLEMKFGGREEVSPPRLGGPRQDRAA